jgi:putative MFS transporter
MDERSLTVSEAVEEIGVGPFQHKLLVICGASWAADAMEVIIISYVIPIVVSQWSLTSGQAGFIGTAIFLGMLIGAWFWGTITDYVGRKIGFQITVLVDSVFGFLSALSPSYIWLVILRTLTGFGVGGTLPVDYAVFSEYLPRRNRGRYLVLLESFWALGTIVVAGLAWFILPRAPNVGWRVLLAVSALPGAVVYFIRRHIPESPRYLVIEGREEEARQVLQHVARENGKTLHLDRLEVEERTEAVTVTALWRSRFVRTTVMLWVAWFAISLGYYGVFIWLPGIFVERGFEFLRTYQNTFLLALAQLPGYFSAAYLVEHWGRKATLAVYLVFSGVFTYLFAVVTGLPFIVGTAMLMSFFTLGAWGVLYAYTPELYPTEVRATGMGWASGMTRIAGAIAPILGGQLLAVSLVLPLSLYAVSFIVGGLTVLLLGRETKGRPLTETVTAHGG